MKNMVLILDDENNIRQDLEKHLGREGLDVCLASNIEEANKYIRTERIDFAIIDLKLDYHSDFGGIKVIENLNKYQPSARAIILTAFGRTPEINDEVKNVEINGFVWKGGPQNYIKAIIRELDKTKRKQPPKKCFVIMPFSKTKTCREEEWTDIFENILKPAVEKCGFNYVCQRANLRIGNIIRDILDNINKADIVIADLTDQNPNVFYELGVRHALRNRTVLISQNMKHVPFDLRPYATIIYDYRTKPGRDDFKIEIAGLLKELEENPNNTNVISPVREYLEMKT